MDGDGQATYSMTVDVPPGILGVQPKVEIAYSSGQGNGLLGIGGSLGGFSSIVRCGSTVAQDQIARPVMLDDKDYFCLNNQRLVQSKGSTYGANGAEYHTQLESFQLVTSYGSVSYPTGGSSPDRFVVLGKGGSKLVFGNDASSRTIDSQTGVPTSWNISYLEDKHGNRIDYSYQDLTTTNSAGVKSIEVLPSTIRYGRNDAMNVAGELFIDLVYEDRPDTSTSAYRRGHKIVSTKRLSNIQTRVGSDVVKDYRISYEQSPVNGASRIKQLIECAGNGNCLLPVTFNWHDADGSWTSATQTTPEALLTADGLSRGEMLDLNNDGWIDQVVSYKKSDGSIENTTYLRNASGWQADSAYQLPDVLLDYETHDEGTPVGQFVDINGDAKADFIVAYEADGQTNNAIYLNTGSGWQATGSLPSILFSVDAVQGTQTRASLIDMNFDALPDVVQTVQLSDGTTLTNTWINTLDIDSQTQTWELNANYALPVPLISYVSNPKGIVQGQLDDINSDGYIDIIQSYTAENGVSTNKVLLGSGTNSGLTWTEAPEWALPVVVTDLSVSQTGQNKALLVDVNADGLTDVMQSHQFANGSKANKTWLNTGLGWVLDNDYKLPTQLVRYVTNTAGGDDYAERLASLSDLNSDGKLDVLTSYLDSSGQRVQKAWLKTDSGWTVDNNYFPPLPVAQLQNDGNSRAHAIFIDINNDGSLDQVLSLEGDSQQAFLSGVAGDADGLAMPTTVTEIYDGFNNRHQINYSLGLHDGMYTPDADGVYPNVDISGPMLLVTAIDFTDDAGGSARSTTQYFGKKANVIGRGSLGYRSKYAVDERTFASVTSEFYQDFPLIGLPKLVEKRTETGVLLSRTESGYTTLNLFGGLTFIQQPTLKTTQAFELDGSLVRTTKESSTFDQFANPVTSQVVIEDANGAQYIKNIENQYINDVANWRIGLATGSKETSTAPNTPAISTETRLSYSGYNVTEKVSEPGHQHAITETSQYNGFGHVVQSTVSASDVPDKTTSSTYTSDGRFAATVTNALGHTGSSEFHPHFGQVTRAEDALGRVVLKLYDEHGRQVKETKLRLASDAITHNDTSNVSVFHLCTPVPGSVIDANGTDITPAANPSCPSNAVYYLGAVDNDNEAPETSYYDARQKVVRKQTQGFDGTSVYIDTEYDSYGRKSRVSLPYYKGDTPRWGTYEYDVLDRVVKVTKPDGTFNTKSYSGLTSVTTNAIGQKSTTIVDVRGKPVEVIDNMGNSLRYTYNAVGELLTTTDSHNNVITIEYDDLGRKISQDDPDLGVWEYQYDAYGQLVWQKDAKGQITTSEFDVAGRIIKRVDGEAAGSPETLWEYDTAENGLGKLTKVSNSDGYVREHRYDLYGRPIESIVTYDGETHSTETGYLNLREDKVDYMRYPSGLMVRKTYNEYGFPLEIRSNGLVEYEQYTAKLTEAESFRDQAIVYQNETEAERLALYNEARAEERLGNQDQEQGQRFAEKAQSYIGKYNSSISTYQAAQSRLNQKVKEIQSVQRQLLAEDKAIRIYLKDDYPGLFIKMVINPVTGKSEPARKANRASRGDIKAANKHVDKALALRDKLDALEVEMNALADAARRRYDNVKFYEGLITDNNNQAQGWFNQANAHYRIANQKGRQITAIDDEIARLSDSAKLAADTAETLLDQYEDSSLAHWEALSADAEGKVLRFKQGKHVTTSVSYDASNGRLNSVIANSDASVQEQNSAANYSGSVDNLNDWLSSLELLQSQYQADEQSAQAEKNFAVEQRTLTITNATFHRENNDVAMALLDDAEKHRLDVEIANQDAVISLNQQLQALTSSAKARGEDLLAAHNTDTEYKASLLNVSFYQAKADYHNAIEALYRSVSDSQVAASVQYRQLALETPDGIDTLSDLSQSRLVIAGYNASRQVAQENSIQQGFGALSNALGNQYTDRDSGTALSKMVGDVYQGRGDVYLSQRAILENVFRSAQGVNSIVSQIHDLKGQSELATRYAQNSTLGNTTLASYQRLGELYQNRADNAVSDAASEALENQHLDAQNQASFSQLAVRYSVESELYADMAEPVFWQNFFNELGDSQIESSNVYLAQADHHNAIALSNQELMEDARNELDHAVIGFDGLVLNDTYAWDAIGNLTERRHGAVDLTQSFEYDALNRLVSTQLSGKASEYYAITGQTEQTFEYDAVGNMTYKSDAGTFEYGANGAGPHAVTRVYGPYNESNYTYDANGNQISGDRRTLEYSSFNKPVDIQKDGNRSQFVYGPERQMIKEVTTDAASQSVKTVYHLGGSYEKTIEGPDITHRYHISTANGATIAVLIDKEDDFPRTNYLHRDHLDSIVAITDERGFVLERFHYDAFGQRRTAVGVDAGFLTNVINLDISDRGFTGHKMLPMLKLIHMKGRVFDPIIGRFLSADPHIQFAGHTQNYNRYSYVMNNPLAFNDPSGYFLSHPYKKLKKLLNKSYLLRNLNERIVKNYEKRKAFYNKYKQEVKLVVAIVVAALIVYFSAGTATGIATSIVGSATAATAAGALAVKVIAGAIVGALAGAASGFIVTGSFKGALQGAVFGAVTGGFAAYVNSASFAANLNSLSNTVGVSAQTLQKTILTFGHAHIGGVQAKLNGGSFSKGFLRGGISKLGAIGTGVIEVGGDFATHVARGLATGVVSGAVADMAGGSFSQGFFLGGLAYAVNQMQSSLKSGRNVGNLQVTSLKNSIIYEDIELGGRVVLENDVHANGIPIVSEDRIFDALDISRQEGYVTVRVLSGYRPPNHPTSPSINHERFNAIDISIEGYTSTQTARAMYASGHFHRVSGYPNSNLQSAHGDDRTFRRGGCYIFWSGPKC
ncbi:MAG: RHS repeat-associated core domain-containing protein [Arenicella sp.]